MDGKVSVSREQLWESLRTEIEQTLAGVAAAVNNAPEGRVISGSEQQVKELMDSLRAKVLQRALQMKADSVESAFSPDRSGGQADGEQGPIEPLNADGLRESGIDPPSLAKRDRHRHGAGRRGAGSQ